MAKRILIVDDDAAIRELIRRVLDHPVFALTEASNPAEAQQEFERAGADLAILDLVMPGGSGAELMRTLLAAPRAPKVIVISSLASLYASRNEVPAGVVVLPKPFSIKELRQHVFEKLDILDPRRSSE